MPALRHQSEPDRWADGVLCRTDALKAWGARGTFTKTIAAYVGLASGLKSRLNAFVSSVLRDTGHQHARYVSDCGARCLNDLIGNILNIARYTRLNHAANGSNLTTRISLGYKCMHTVSGGEHLPQARACCFCRARLFCFTPSPKDEEAF